jgi:protein-S-isoprenylcysteine O-methyltransferase Ste14
MEELDMATSDSSSPGRAVGGFVASRFATLLGMAAMWRIGYRIFAYFGLMSLSAALIWGFRYSGAASGWNYVVNVLLYTAFVAPHLLLTQPDVKQSIWGRWAGTLRERQWYIGIAIVSWLAVLWLHRPVPGGALALSEPLRFAGLIGALWAMLLFFQGSTVQMLDGLLGVPGTDMKYSHGAQTPLQTEGQYAQVRHPMYRAAMLIGLASLVYHPTAGQLLWTLMVGATFIGFIPLEEAQLLEARGDEYRLYCERTPYRLFRYIW